MSMRKCQKTSLYDLDYLGSYWTRSQHNMMVNFNYAGPLTPTLKCINSRFGIVGWDVVQACMGICPVCMI